MNKKILDRVMVNTTILLLVSLFAGLFVGLNVGIFIGESTQVDRPNQLRK